MNTTTTGARWQYARWAAVVVGFVVSALLVWQASYAAFSATTDNSGNNWSAGTVKLTDDDSGSVLFTMTNMKPGDTSTNCIQVTYTGTLAAAVKLYGKVMAPTAPTPDLSPFVQLKVEQGTGGGFGNCTGFTPNATTPVLFNGNLGGTTAPFAMTDWNSGLTTAFTPTGGTGAGYSETYTFRFTATLDPAANNTAQGGSVTANFIWEAQNS